MANWSQLPEELVVLIAIKLPTIEDLVRLSAVCHSLQSAISQNKLFLVPKLPWPMIVKNEGFPDHNFINFLTKKILRLNLPEVLGRQCFGSPYGCALGILRVCDINCLRPAAIEFVAPPEDVRVSKRIYLVEFCGELHMVVRRFSNEEGHEWIFSLHPLTTISFDVYRLDFRTRKWMQLDTLDDHALFLGCNSSFSILGTDFPDCKGNCIYFTDDCKPRRELLCGFDMGIFNFKEKTMEQLYDEFNTLSLYCAPVWITPTPMVVEQQLLPSTC
ncbi:hypothetical protein IFM89_028231 [Coptis chinensis]|uniref:F-box domain-containing protein n=1 Tax=Coptis chinensis TaxID=261450 RepID=A0A835IUE3_9MAGN|nr:hypothetical protein IFM89_028231 [Coptis chinensis]